SPASGWYVNHEGVPVIGAYHPLSQTGIGILIEQKQSEILAFNDQIAATLIGGVLAMALVTTAISAIVIRQITRPVIRLTESALVMAEGNLDQYVPVTSRDEIGILTYVFNKMAAELKSLYDDLEGKVVARTRMLQQANYQIQRRAIQLEASLEVSQAVTSIRDPVILLSRVADRIRDRFVYASVAVYLVEPGGGQARLHAVSPLGADWPDRVRTGDGSVMERALRKNAAQVQNQVLSQDSEWYYSRTLARVAVPLRMEERVLGALAVVSTEREVMQEDDLKVLEHLANQVAIALENARAYERERLAALQLEENEAFKARFMANMSHELREPLNSIIGFSRLMLKGFGDPLTDQQREDIQRINANSQHLMDLINDILMITEIQAGLMDLKPRSVDLGNLIESVLPTAGALTRGKPITLAQDIEPGLPPIWGDPDRVRQILVRLLTNAALFTNKGQISLRAWSDDEVVYVSIQDTGVGIPQLDRERIFQGFEKIETGDICSDGPGLGLALSREFVELHGGKMWLESELGKGSTFTFSLPQLRKPEPAATAGDRNQDDAVPAVVAAEERQQRYPDAHASHAPGI
ncbi:MAG: GAF domain-containing protein, partial [Anaerolineae bacterium]|nr:GAF domain-containing protein [Anaerolineae bacterium]